MSRLTPEQRSEVEANMGLVGEYLRQRAPRWLVALYSWDDAYQTCSTALIAAVQGYDPLRDRELSTYAEKAMYNALLYWGPKQKAVSCPKSSGKLYMGTCELEDTPEVRDESLDFFRQLAAEAVGRLSTKEKQLLDLLMEGKRPEAIQAELRFSKSQFYRARQVLFARLRDIFN